MKTDNTKTKNKQVIQSLIYVSMLQTTNKTKHVVKIKIK